MSQMAVETELLTGEELLALGDIGPCELIDTSDIPPLSEKFFTTAQWRMPKSTVRVTVEVEPEVVEWFKAQGDHCERYLAAALRIYARAHQVSEMAKAG